MKWLIFAFVVSFSFVAETAALTNKVLMARVWITPCPVGSAARARKKIGLP